MAGPHHSTCTVRVVSTPTRPYRWLQPLRDVSAVAECLGLGLGLGLCRQLGLGLGLGLGLCQQLGLGFKRVSS